MPENPEDCDGPEDFPAWVQELHARQKEEAIRFAGHAFDEDGWHDEDACRTCLEKKAVVNACKCGQCCRLLIEVELQDAEREPKIKERGSPIFLSGEETASGRKEHVGYFLNSRENDGACVFLDTATNLCGIYESRPLLCRLFDCDGEGREQLIQLGILER